MRAPPEVPAGGCGDQRLSSKSTDISSGTCTSLGTSKATRMQERLRQWEGVSVPLGLEEMLARTQNSYPDTGYAGLSSQGLPSLWLHVLPSPLSFWRPKCWCLQPGTHSAPGDGILELPWQDREEKTADLPTSPAPRLEFVTLRRGLSPECLWLLQPGKVGADPGGTPVWGCSPSVLGARGWLGFPLPTLIIDHWCGIQLLL